jgi:putative methionine-R-sulfoxide reductase with GAF domain
LTLHSLDGKLRLRDADLVWTPSTAGAYSGIAAGDFVPADMSTHSTLDRESFQKLLASAFVVQESLTGQSGSLIVELLPLIVARELDVNGAMHVIANRARNVTGATGVAIGLLKGDQLVYRAGSGSAATLVGRQVMATLSVSANAEARREILRVEDAETDAGIGGAVCRQFGAKSLLILPIYDDRTLAGVLEVFFNEAHVFQDREVCTYQLMARVVGEAMAHAVLLERKKALSAERAIMPQGIGQITNQNQRFPSDGGSRANKHAVRPTSRAAIAEVETLASRRASPGAVATMISYRARRRPWHTRLWRFADRAAVVIALVTASWIAYSYRRPVSPLGPSAGPTSSATKQHVPFAPHNLVPAETDMSKPQIASVSMEEARKVAGSTPRRVRIGDNEIDYISDDVTVRHFIPNPARQQVSAPGYRVDYISDDVTVRHFTPKLTVAPSQPVDRSADSDRSRK